MTFVELDSLVDLANHYQGAVVEDILFSKGLLYLGLQTENSKQWLIFDAQSAKPGFYLTGERPPSMKAETKPLLLFLKAHLKGGNFLEASRLEKFGRVVVLTFETPAGEKLEIEGHLFSQNKNILVRRGKSKISLVKPKALQEVEIKDYPAEVRSVAQLYREWTAEQDPKKPIKDIASLRQKELEKKQRGLEKLKESLIEIQDEPWQRAASWLALHRTLEDIPLDLQKYIDITLSVQENIQRAYSLAKQSKNKKTGSLERVAVLEREISDLNKPVTAKDIEARTKKKPDSLLLDSKGRTKVFNAEISAYIGKNASDNLNLLRKAKPWYLWLHAKDMPGSHGIISLPKNKTVPDEILREVARWVLKVSLSAKQWGEWQGLKQQIIYCECRFVSPIKGDKLGRVRHKNERVLTLIV